MNVISLFSGAGGLDLGLEAAGLTVRLAVERDADCRKTLQRNRPDWNVSSLHGGDISKFSAAELLSEAGLRPGQVDVVAGGPPCQSFSTIGNGRGSSDPRGKMSLTYLRLISELKPKLFVFENVTGILRHRSVINRLRDLKTSDGVPYRVEHRVLNSAEYGVPQLRKRVFFIGRLGNGNITFPVATHARPALASENGLPPYRTVGEALDLPIDLLLRDDNLFMNHTDMMIERMSHIGIGQNFKALPMRLRPPCWKNGRHQGSDTFGRLDPSKPSVTIRCSAYNPTKGRYIHPFKNRGLSTVEMAILQTFPTDYCFVGSMASVGRQIGNAVPPDMAKKIGLEVKRMLKKRA